VLERKSANYAKKTDCSQEEFCIPLANEEYTAVDTGFAAFMGAGNEGHV
jgi:hypothetical protein